MASIGSLMSMDVVGYILLSALLWKLGVPVMIAIGVSVVLGASFGMRDDKTCLCINNKPMTSLYSSMRSLGPSAVSASGPYSAPSPE